MICKMDLELNGGLMENVTKENGNKINETNVTRVSFDFRVIPNSRYIPSEHTSVNMKIPFKVGGFYGGIV